MQNPPACMTSSATVAVEKDFELTIQCSGAFTTSTLAVSWSVVQ